VVVIRRALARALRACANRLDPPADSRWASATGRTLQAADPPAFVPISGITTGDYLPPRAGRHLGQWIPGDRGNGHDNESGAYVRGCGASRDHSRAFVHRNEPSQSAPPIRGYL